MTRYTHLILFFFALALALLCSAVLMLYLNGVWHDAGFVTLVATALILALIVPAAAALASLRLVTWQQPLTAWAVFYLLTGATSLIAGTRMLD